MGGRRVFSLARDDQTVLDPRMYIEDRNNLTRFDAVTPDLDLMIDTPYKGKLSIWQIASKISRFVEKTCSWPRTERMRNKALSGQHRLIMITLSQSDSPNIEFTRLPDWHLLHVLIKQINLCIGNRSAN